jgi:hypothetical protein
VRFGQMLVGRGSGFPVEQLRVYLRWTCRASGLPPGSSNRLVSSLDSQPWSLPTRGFCFSFSSEVA